MSYPEKIVQLLKENEQEEAIKLLIEAIDVEPNEPLHYVNMGTVLYQYKQYEQAEQFFMKALQKDDNVATAYFGLANIYYELNNYTEAEQVLKKCISLQLEDADVYYLLGMTYVKQQNNLLALPFLQRASELRDDANYLFQYGLALAKTNHFVEAKQIFEKTLINEADHADALYNLAIICIHEDEIDKALSFLKRSINVNPNHHLAKNALKQLKRNVH